MDDILIENADYIVTIDGERRIIRDGFVAIRGNKIRGVGKTSQIREQIAARHVINGRGKLVLPGLISCHIHTKDQLARGLMNNINLSSLKSERLYPYRINMTREHAYHAAALTCLELIKTGTTCFLDFALPGGGDMEPAIQVTEDAGLRGIVTHFTVDTHGTIGIPDSATTPTDIALKDLEEFLLKNRYRAEDRLRPWAVIIHGYSGTDELWKGVRELVSEQGMGITTHIGCTKDTTKETQKRHSMSEIERLDKLGVLGHNIVAVHMNQASYDDLAIAKKHDVKVCHCPTISMMGMGSCSFIPGIDKFIEMMDMGIIVALGSDGAWCSAFADMVRVMYQVAYHREVREDPEALTAQQILEMATINGAKALLWEDEIGSLEAGKKADVILLDINRPEWIPIHDPVSNLIYSASGDSVETVIVDGKILMENKEVKTLDQEKVIREGQKASTDLANRALISVRDLSSWPMV